MARITDTEVNEHLRKVLSQSGYIGQAADRRPPNRMDGSLVSMSFSMGATLTPEQGAIAGLVATARANARLASERLQQAEEALESARRQAEQIAAAAREAADKEVDHALKQAAEMVRDARKQSERIITDAHREAGKIITAAQDSRTNRVRSQSLGGIGTAGFIRLWDNAIEHENPAESNPSPLADFSQTQTNAFAPVQRVDPAPYRGLGFFSAFSSPEPSQPVGPYTAGKLYLVTAKTFEGLRLPAHEPLQDLTVQLENLAALRVLVSIRHSRSVGKLGKLVRPDADFVYDTGAWNIAPVRGRKVFIAQAKHIRGTLDSQQNDPARMTWRFLEPEYFDLLIEEFSRLARPNRATVKEFISAIVASVDRYHEFPESIDSICPVAKETTPPLRKERHIPTTGEDSVNGYTPLLGTRAGSDKFLSEVTER